MWVALIIQDNSVNDVLNIRVILKLKCKYLLELIIYPTVIDEKYACVKCMCLLNALYYLYSKLKLCRVILIYQI